jgi:type II secretory pathway component PulF
MPTFQYKALQANGALAEGQLEAAGRPEAFRQMEGLGLRPVSLSEKTAAAAKGFALPALASFSFSRKTKKVSPRMLENFTRLLSSLLASGVPLSRALVILCKEASTPAASEKWKEIHDQVVDGMSLADSMAKSPDTFPRVYVAMVQAGETGGFLDVVLAQIADFQSREKELKSKVMAAMLYPTILFVLAVAVLIFLLTFFIPKFQALFKNLGAALPLPTQIVLAISHGVRSYGVFVAVGLVLLGYGVHVWVMSEKGRWWRSLPWPGSAGCWARCWARACRWCRASPSPANPSATKSSWTRCRTPSNACSRAASLARAWPIAAPCSPARCWKWFPSRKKAAGWTRNWSASPPSPRATWTGN